MMKRLSLYAGLLATIPAFAYLSSWHWQLDLSYGRFSYFLYLITETAGNPYSLFTCGIFALIYFFSLKNKITALKVVTVMALAVALTQGIKSVVKPLVQENRPFMEKVLATLPQDEHFYGLKKSQRATIVRHFHQRYVPQTPDWLVKHRASKTGFSFPSGHSMFVAIWVMLLVGFAQLFPQNRHLFYLANFATVWAMLVLVSRLQLGMHFPIDEITSIFVSWGVGVVLFHYLQRYKWER